MEATSNGPSGGLRIIFGFGFGRENAIAVSARSVDFEPYDLVRRVVLVTKKIGVGSVVIDCKDFMVRF